MRALGRATILAILGALALSACAAAPSGSAPSATAGASPTGGGGAASVTIKGFAFSPATLTVRTGTTVTFTNGDSAAHTITSGAGRTKDGKFDRPIAGGATTTITFDAPGTYAYFCALHSSMPEATIVVQP